MAEQRPKKISSLRGVHHKLELAHNTHRTVYVAFGIVMIVVALLILAASAVGRTTGVSTCKHIILATQRNQCYLSYASTTQNISVCSGISATQASYQCIETVAEGKKSVQDCSGLSAYQPRYVDCVLNISYSTQNATSCGLLDPINGSQCAYSIAISKNFSSISYCSAITLAPERLICDSNYYYTRAYSTGNDSYCGHLTTSANATISESLLADNANASSGLSSYYASDLSPSDLCYIVVGKSTNSLGSCAKISNATYQGICGYYLNSTLNGASNSTIPSELCTSNNSFAGQLCQYTLYSNLASAQDNLTKCDLISNVTYKYYCMVGVATKYSNVTDCKSIENQTILSGCEFQAGLTAGNYTT